MERPNCKVIFLANSDWYLLNFRLGLANYLRDQGFQVVMMSPGGDFVEQLQNSGFRWEPLRMDRAGLNPLKELGVVIKLARFLRKEQPALVHGFTLKCAVYGALAARWVGTPAKVAAVTGMGHVFTSEGAKARVIQNLVRSLLRLGLGDASSRLILQNPDDVRHFRERRIVDPGRIRLIRGSGVDCERFSPPEDPEFRPRTPFRVLLAARLLWKKGIAEYVQASRILQDQGRSIRFLLAGTPDPGNPASVDAATVKAWSDAGLVEHLGHVDDMAALMRAADALVLPSYYGEGVPRSLLEGAASGLPIVTTDGPGCREVVTDGVEGLLVPAQDPPALAEAIARLEDDPAMARRMGAAARERAVSEFDELIVFRLTAAVYRELLAEPTPSPRAETQT